MMDLVLIIFQYYQKLAKREGCDDNSIIIYTESSFSSIKNDKMLVDGRKIDWKTRAITNDIYQDLTLEADMPGFLKVWHNPNSFINILSYKDARKRFSGSLRIL